MKLRGERKGPLETRVVYERASRESIRETRVVIVVPALPLGPSRAFSAGPARQAWSGLQYKKDQSDDHYDLTNATPS